MKVAKWMGVAPWDLAQQPVAWYRMALLAMSLEAQRSNAERGN